MTTITNTNDWSIDIPTEPTPCLVIVKNISPKTEEAAIKDFFSFCGVINAFEMKKSSNDDYQLALVHFEKESAAKTATLLSQAVVDDSPIEVEPYFSTAVPAATENTTEMNKEVEAANQPQETKSASRIMAELLASGYVLTESVIAKGVEFDEKHNVSTRFNGYLNKVGINLDNLSQKWHRSSSSSNDIGSNNVNERSATADTEHVQGNSRMQNLMNSRASLKVQGFASRIANKVSNVHEEAKRIAVSR
ncbi:MAG: hypothetical protein EXX96DRAFT_572177 [Benjaminiella poitrasii]|nr:MAG: hypothetical protein EXX96DRAFT_572177 [Benjaminiella poitrasii]